MGRDLKKSFEISGSDVTTFESARREFDLAVGDWCSDFGPKLTPNHYLILRPEKIYWSKERTRYQRNADLMLNASVSGMSEDKCLAKDVIVFAAEWPNE